MYYMEFENHTNMAKLLPKDTANDNLLYLYSRYKQATIGDCNIPQPNSFLNMKEYYKWNAWNEISGMTQEQAKKEYINKVKELYK